MDYLIRYALSFLGVPYIYGANNRLVGLDCSGFVNEILRPAGIVKRFEDLSAQMLYNKLEAEGTMNTYKTGSIIFFGQSVTKITHVAFMLDRFLMLEAGGGGPECTTVEIAMAKGAMVRLSHINSRQDVVAVIYPRYNSIGLI